MIGSQAGSVYCIYHHMGIEDGGGAVVGKMGLKSGVERGGVYQAQMWSAHHRAEHYHQKKKKTKFFDTAALFSSARERKNKKNF